MKKRIKIIIPAVIVLIIILLITSCVGGHKNTTGRNDYRASKVRLNCYYEKKDDIRTTKTSADFIFNTKEYKAVVYYKTVFIYKEKISDEKYEDMMWQLDSLECQNGDTCKKDHIRLGVTNYGLDTIADRKGKEVILTYYKEFGQGEKASKKFIEKTKKEYIKNGYKCQ